MTKAPHPATVMSKFDAGGTVSAFTVAEQWKQVADWHAFLQDESSEYPALESLNLAWQDLDAQYEIGGKRFIERGRELSKVSQNPLSTLFYFVDMGFYPPPELLLALQDCWETYKAATGRLTLEECFLDRPVKGGGNYARRSFSRFRNLSIQWDFSSRLGNGESRQTAAEAISLHLRGKPDADSILRMCRGVKATQMPRSHPAEK